jgi:enoyl-CoA hydratase/carnithine racemase
VKHVRMERRGATGHVVISRVDKRNALSSEVYVELGEAFAVYAGEETVRCLVLRAGGPMFSAGNDVRELAGLVDDPGCVRRCRPTMLAAVNALEQMSLPTIAQLHGACLGGAAELALACDLRVMAQDATIGLIETRLGLIPDLGGSSRLPAIVGLGRAKDIIMTGRALDSAEALQIGLANRVAAPDLLDTVTAELSAQLMSNGPLAVGAAKRLLDAAAKPVVSTTLELEVTAQDALVRTDDFAEGARAVLDRRTPTFTGR